MAMRDDIKEILLTDEQIAARIKELAEALTADYKNKNPIVICILKGAAVFMTDLIRQRDFPLEIDCMSGWSYGAGTISSGIVRYADRRGYTGHRPDARLSHPHI
jgi:hypoxanthine phosphoribosyltransferase